MWMNVKAKKEMYSGYCYGSTAGILKYTTHGQIREPVKHSIGIYPKIQDACLTSGIYPPLTLLFDGFLFTHRAI